MLGMPIEEYMVESGGVTLADACRRAVDRLKGAQKAQMEFGELFVRDGVLQTEDEQLAAMDEFAWGLAAKVLNIPSPYLMRLNPKMRELNVNYWLNLLDEKQATLVFKDMELLDFAEGMQIDVLDILDILLTMLPDAHVMRVTQQTNASVWDIVDLTRSYDSPHDHFAPGLRVVIKEGLNAPEVMPIFVNRETSGVVEFADRFDKLNIKSLSYNDILHVVSERVADCVNSSDSLFSMYSRIEGEYLEKPRRRVQHLCNEHHIPGRVEAYALREFDDQGLSTSNFGNIIGLFSTLGFVDEVKQSSERKLQQLAGHVVTQTAGECRCSACDALELSDAE